MQESKYVHAHTQAHSSQEHRGITHWPRLKTERCVSGFAHIRQSKPCKEVFPCNARHHTLELSNRHTYIVLSSRLNQIVSNREAYRGGVLEPQSTFATAPHCLRIQDGKESSNIITWCHHNCIEKICSSPIFTSILMSYCHPDMRVRSRAREFTHTRTHSTLENQTNTNQ